MGRDLLKIRIEGPIESNYSLAVVNRSLAKTIHQLFPDWQVSVLPLDEHACPIPLSKEFLDKNPDIATMYERGISLKNPHVAARFHYPPNVCNMTGIVNVISGYGWEESAFPWRYICQFNKCLDGAAVLSRYVKKVLRDNGLTIPITVMGTGADHLVSISPQKPDLPPDWDSSPDDTFIWDLLDNPQRPFIFLHISSCFPRKAPELLVHAFLEAFRSRPETAILIIKTFPNPHNRIEHILQGAYQQNGRAKPRIVLLNCDIPENHLVWLFSKTDCLVMPSRGEGFGLPAAEAMFYRIPVITTAYGGQADFCTNDTAWLVNYRFEPAKTHMKLFDSVWAEPDIDHLTYVMRKMPDLPRNEIRKRVESAYKTVRKRYSWERTARNLLAFCQDLLRQKDVSAKKPCTNTSTSEAGKSVREKVNIGFVTPWNIRCGIAEYNKMMLEPLIAAKGSPFAFFILAPWESELESPDESFVIRCWHRHHPSVISIAQRAYELGLKAVVIQFHFAFFSVELFGELVRSLKALDINVYVFIHAMRLKDGSVGFESITDTMALVDRIFCHTIIDLNAFKDMGLTENVCLFPHAVPHHDDSPSPEQGLIGFFGFLLPHKGLRLLLRAVKILRNTHKIRVRLLCISSIYPAVSSFNEMHHIKRLMKDLCLEEYVEWHRSFLPVSHCLKLLSRTQLIVLPYLHTMESSSAAVRMALAATRPVLCTPLSIFDDVREIVHFSRSTTPEDIASAMKDLLTDNGLLESKMDRQISWIESRTWNRIARRFSGLLKGDMKENSL